MTTDRVMLLIDADNVSVDVIDQAVRLLMKQHGALHVRRAYCTPEGALKHQAAFKRLGIKPMVNLAAGKNSTDIALAVDAIDLVLAERPDVVAIASSDSDFAPLVQRLREKGCVVRGIGQQGKVGDETQDVYDDFTVLEHRKPAASAATADKPARKTAAKSTRKAPVKTAAKVASTRAEEPVQAAAPVVPSAPPAPAVSAVSAAPAATARKAAAKSTRRAATKTAAKTVAQQVTQEVAQEVALDVADAVASIVAAKPAVERPPASAQHEIARKILESMPELNRGDRLELRVASQRLREAGLISKSGSSTKLLGQFPELFELVPPGQPNHLRLRR